MAGMRERVALYGGTIETEQRDDGCVVKVQLPVEAPA